MIAYRWIREEKRKKYRRRFLSVIMALVQLPCLYITRQRFVLNVQHP